MSAISAVTGAPGHGKSTFLTALGAHVAYGWTFMGRSTSQRKVLLLDVENSLPVVTGRLERLSIQDGDPFRVLGGWNDQTLDPRKSYTRVLNWAVRTHPKPLIIIDSFRGFLQGEENDSGVVRAFMDKLRTLADAGAGVLVLHHPGKGESAKKFRGSSDFEAALHVAYSLVNFGERRLDKLRLKAFKARLSVDDDLILRYNDGQFTTDDQLNAVAKTVTEQLADFLRRNGGITTSEFEKKAGDAGLGRNRARQFLTDGVVTGPSCVPRAATIRRLTH